MRKPVDAAPRICEDVPALELSAGTRTPAKKGQHENDSDNNSDRRNRQTNWPCLMLCLSDVCADRREEPLVSDDDVIDACLHHELPGPRVLRDLRAASIIKTAQAARLCLLWFVQQSPRRHHHCDVSGVWIARALQVQEKTVQNALAEWPAVIRSGRVGMRKRHWKLAQINSRKPGIITPGNRESHNKNTAISPAPQPCRQSDRASVLPDTPRSIETLRRLAAAQQSDENQADDTRDG